MNASKLNNIRNDAAEIQDYLEDLSRWEKEIKKEDRKLSSSSKEESVSYLFYLILALSSY